jgi:hypothetical protein
MTPEQRQKVQFDTLQRAIAVIQAYQNKHWRRLRVAQVCFDLKSLLREEANRVHPSSEASKEASGQAVAPRRRASDLVETRSAPK